MDKNYLKLRDLKKVIMLGLKVAVSTSYNKGVDWEGILELPDDDPIWDYEVWCFINTSEYDLVIKVRP